MTAQELIGKYIGQEKIKSVTDPDETGKVVLTFEDDKTLLIFLDVANGWQTDMPSDETALQKLRVIPLVVDIITAMTRHQMRKRDMDLLALQVNETIRQAEEKAGEILYGKIKDDLTIGDFEKILTKDI